MRISDWSSDVCSSDLLDRVQRYEVAYTADVMEQVADGDRVGIGAKLGDEPAHRVGERQLAFMHERQDREGGELLRQRRRIEDRMIRDRSTRRDIGEAKAAKSEEHTSELQSLMRISYAVFCLKKKNK